MDRSRRRHARPAACLCFCHSERSDPLFSFAPRFGASGCGVEEPLFDHKFLCDFQVLSLMFVAQPIEWTDRGIVMLDQRLLPGEEVSSHTQDLPQISSAMIDEAKAVHAEKRATDEAIGRFGAEFMPQNGHVMTQCNAGALATAGIGTALGVFQVAVEQGKKLHVFVPETRPYLQGARLTAWELHRSNIPLTLITDNMVGHFLKTGKVGAIVTA